MSRLSLVTPLCLVLGCTSIGNGTKTVADPSAQGSSDPLVEVKHERQWIDVAPAPIPSGLPLMGPEGRDGAGYPKRVVDRAALRSLFVNQKFTLLTEVLEQFQAEFETNPRFEDRIHDAYDALGYPHTREREVIEAWIAATPRSFAPYLARANYWVRLGYLWRGSKLARDTSEFEFVSMDEAFDRAREDIRKATALRSTLVEARLLTISIEIAGGSREIAERAMEEALALCPSCYHARVEWLWALKPRWGGSLDEMRQFATARADESNPRHRHLLGYVDFERAAVARGKGNAAEAVSLVEQGCALGDEWFFFLERADARNMHTERDVYLADLNRADTLHPGLSEVISRRASAYAEAQRWEEAGRDLLFVLRSNPTSALGISLYSKLIRALDSLGWKEHRNGRSARAARLYELAHALAPKDDEIARHGAAVKRAVRGSTAVADDAPVSGDARPELTVVLVDGSNRPLAGAQIAIESGTANWERLDHLVNKVVTGTARTDVVGRFRTLVNVGPAVVVALFPRQPRSGLAVSVAVPSTGAEVRLTAAASGRIAGKVVDRNRKPVAGMVVRAVPDVERLGEETRSLGMAKTGEDGSFAIEGVDSNRYRLFARGMSYRGPANQSSLGLKVTGGDNGLVIQVAPERSVRGRVLVTREGQSPAPPEHFRVVGPAGAGEHSFSSTDGRFSIAIPNIYSKAQMAFSVEGRPTMVRALALLQEENDIGDVIIGPGRTIRGRIVDPRGFPVWGASVSCEIGPVIAWTVKDGSFEAVVADGPVDLRIRDEHWLTAIYNVKGDEGKVEIHLSAGARLKLLAVEVDGSPIPGAVLRTMTADRPRGCTTDATGRCEIAGLEPGEYWISPSGTPSKDPNRIEPATLHVSLKAEEVRGVTYRWPRARTRLSVRVFDQKGNPSQSGAYIYPRAPSFQEVTDPKGRPKVPYYSIPYDRPLENLPPDQYLVVALGPWGMPTCALTKVTVKPGDDQVLTLRLGDGTCR